MVVSEDLGSKSGRFRVNFPRGGSKIPPPHQYSYDFKWKDYCPMVFRYCGRYLLQNSPYCLYSHFFHNNFFPCNNTIFMHSLSSFNLYYYRSLREMFKIDTNDYLHSICGIHGGLRKISSPGKSGSTFYLSHNDRFLIKTVRKAEAKV